MQETAAREGKFEIEAAPDAALLNDFARSGREEPFNELVRRHSAFVYASALRQVNDPGTAQDITQAVFIVLARKAGTLKQGTILSGWLFRSVRYLALHLHRRAARRAAREQEIAPMFYEKDCSESDTTWQDLTPHLDASLAALGATDRHAVLLRFFERKSWAEVGVVLGSNENAARIRVNRALAKMRSFFEKRGFIVSFESLETLLERVPSTEPLNPPLVQASSANAEELAQLLLRRSRLKPFARVAAFSIVAFMGILFSVNRANKPALSVTQLRAEGSALVREIDRTFTANDAEGFLATILFHGPEDEPFRPVLRDYVAAAGEFRDMMQKRFNSRDAWGVTFRPLFSGNLKTRPEQFRPDLIIVHTTPDYIFMERPSRDGWRWDFFAQISENERAEWIRRLATQAQRFREAANKVRTDAGAEEYAVLQEVNSHK